MSDRKGLPSASSMERLWMCPGSFAAEKAIPEPAESTPVAAAGDRIHLALYKKEIDALGLVEKEVALKLDAMEKEIVSQWRKSNSIEGDIACVREKRYYLNAQDHGTRVVASAQPDVVYEGLNILNDSHALIINYKTGFKEVTEAAQNWQCKAEMVCMTNGGENHYAAVRVAVIQHRLKSFKTQAIYAGSAIVDAAEDIYDVLARASMEDAPRAAGPWCEYCRANASCVQRAIHAEMVLKGLPKLQQDLTLADCAKVYTQKKQVIDFLDAVTKRLKSVSDLDRRSVGLELTDGREVTTVTDATGLYNILKEFGFADLTWMLEHAKISAPQVRNDLLERFSKTLPPAEAEEVVTKIMEPFITKSRTEGSLKKLKS